MNESKKLLETAMILIDENSGMNSIQRERVEQVLKHKRTIEEDVYYNPNGELLISARALTKPNPVQHDFPDSWNVATCRKMMNKCYRDRLIIAGALIAAEIDRFNYISDQKK